jgi:hypothetical protein
MYRQPRTGLSPGNIVLLIGAVLVALVGDRMPGVVAALQLSHAFKTRMDANLRAARVGPPEEVDVYLESAPSFEEFYRAKYRRLFTALCLVTGDRHEAEEVAQEAFVRVFERWDHVGLLDDPTGYVFRVSMNVFRGRYRRASLGLRRALSLAPAATDDLAGVGPMTPSSGCSWHLSPSSAPPSCSLRSWTIRPRRQAECSAYVPPRSAPSRRAPAPA